MIKDFYMKMGTIYGIMGPNIEIYSQPMYCVLQNASCGTGKHSLASGQDHDYAGRFTRQGPAQCVVIILCTCQTVHHSTSLAGLSHRCTPAVTGQMYKQLSSASEETFKKVEMEQIYSSEWVGFQALNFWNLGLDNV